jgi:hypothetical protein
MEAADAEGILYKQLELETEIKKKIRSEIKRCESFWKQIQVCFVLLSNEFLKCHNNK